MKFPKKIGANLRKTKEVLSSSASYELEVNPRNMLESFNEDLLTRKRNRDSWKETLHLGGVWFGRGKGMESRKGMGENGKGLIRF